MLCKMACGRCELSLGHVCVEVEAPFVGFPAALVGGVAATLLEAVAGTKLDNLLIPVGTAAALWVIA